MTAWSAVCIHSRIPLQQAYEAGSHLNALNVTCPAAASLFAAVPKASTRLGTISQAAALLIHQPSSIWPETNVLLISCLQPDLHTVRDQAVRLDAT